MLEYITFMFCLQFAITNSVYCNIILKPKQVVCLESIFFKNDVLCVLPTGYGKSLVFHLLPALLFARDNLNFESLVEIGLSNVCYIVIVVSPLNALMSNQISRLSWSGIRACILGVNETSARVVEADESEEDEHEFMHCVFHLCEEDKVRRGHYHIVFAHPESLVSSEYGHSLLRSKRYQENVCAIVVDEAHCILEWGADFRKDYRRLGVLCATFPDVPVLAMTATANNKDRQEIVASLGLKKGNFKEILGNPDRGNIFYKKCFRVGEGVESIQDILEPLAQDLLNLQADFPLTVIYIPLKWCGFAYKLFDYILGRKQYYPSGAPEIPENRMFGQFHASQTKQMKVEILKQLCSTKGVLRVVFATVAIGMGVDIPSIRHVIHVSPPCSVKAYFQETGRGGRDGKEAWATLYYNNRDISESRAEMQDDMRSFCRNEDICLRHLLLASLDYNMNSVKNLLHLCCSVCETHCCCPECAQ